MYETNAYRQRGRAGGVLATVLVLLGLVAAGRPGEDQAVAPGRARCDHPGR